MPQPSIEMSPLPLTVYTPASALRDPAALIVGMFHDLWRGRGLAWRLFRRDIAAHYRQSILGYLWAFSPPLATTGAFVFLNSQKILVVGDTPIPYAAYVLVGTVLWQSFVDALNSSLRVLMANRSLLTKVNFPREALIMTGLVEVAFNFIIRIPLLIAAFWIFSLPVTNSMLLFPIGISVLMLLGLSLGLLLTPIGILYGDISRALPILTTFWFMLTPIVYPPPQSGLASYLITMNPVSPVIMTTRDWLISQPATSLTGFLVVTGLALMLLLLSAVIYRVALPHLIARMGS